MAKNVSYLQTGRRNVSVAAPAPEEVTSVESSDDSNHSDVFDPKALAEEMVDMDLLKENPDNEVFRGMKTAEDLQVLEKDMAETGLITPIMVTRDYMLISGESRLRIARKLNKEGNPFFKSGRIKVRIYQENLSKQTIKKRLILDNMARFTVNPAEKAFLLSEAYGGSEGLSKVSNRDLAAQAGVSIRQTQNLKAEVRAAESLATEEGRSPQPEDFEKAKKIKNQKRKVVEKAPQVTTNKAPKPDKGSLVRDILLKKVEGYLLNAEILAGKENVEGFRKALALIQTDLGAL